MRFSYNLLRKLVPKVPKKSTVIDGLNFHAFESEDGGGDTLDISIHANRYSDASSHLGIARLLSAIHDLELSDATKTPAVKASLKDTQPEIKIFDKNGCPRYIGRYFEISEIKASPKWLQDILSACGARAINNVVDVMNYVMLLTGQPLHAFDADLLDGGIQVRSAKSGEDITTIDGLEYILGTSDLVIADKKGVIAIAGVKGGKRAEVNEYTKRIIVESASFEGYRVAKTSATLNLSTDASQRFSHVLSPALAEKAIQYASLLLKEVCRAKAGESSDVGGYIPEKHIIKFDRERFSEVTGMSLAPERGLDYLKKLGFRVRGVQVEVPAERTDVRIFEDLVEEVVNLHGYENIPSVPPRVVVAVPAEAKAEVALKRRIRERLANLGLSELYNYSFTSEELLERTGGVKWWGAIRPENPISAKYEYLRPSLAPNLIDSVHRNMRFFKEVRVFEVGHVFVRRKGKIEEDLMLGIALNGDKNVVLDMKGVIDGLLSGLRVHDYGMYNLQFDMTFLEELQSLAIKSANKTIGYLGRVKSSASEEPVAVAEIYFSKLVDAVQEEIAYKPPSKFPAVLRDVSLLVDQEVRVGDIFTVAQLASKKLLQDVDLIDFYVPEDQKADKKSVTLRLVFQSDKTTLVEEEIENELERITASLKLKFGAEIR